MKSSARSIGANGLADICQDMETAGKNEDWAVIKRNAPRLGGLMREIESYISSIQV